MSELTARQSIQTTVQAQDSFESGTVTINDWSVLDSPGALDNGNYLIILASQRFSATYPRPTPETVWHIEAVLFRAWDKDWQTTLEAFAAARQDIVDAFTDGSARVPDTDHYYDVREIREGGEIVMHDRDSLTWMNQTLIFEVEETL